MQTCAVLGILNFIFVEGLNGFGKFSETIFLLDLINWSVRIFEFGGGLKYDKTTSKV